MDPAADKRAQLKEWLATGEARLYPLTYSQRELWEASVVPVPDPANHICSLIYIDGALKQGDCEGALRAVIARQEALGISFLPGKEKPLQMVRKTPDRDLKYRELTPEQARPESLEAIADEICRVPFDMVRGPLFRVEMVRLAENSHVFIFAIHHAIADGWSLGVFVEDLFAAYLNQVSRTSAGVPLPPVPLTYTAWGASEREFWTPAELEKRAEFWKTTLKGIRPLWTHGTAGIGKAPLRRWVSHFPSQLDRGARELARRGGATKFSVLLTAFQLALGKWVGKDDFVVGTPVANRTRQIVRETMGYFSGNVPLRSRVDQGRKFLENLGAVHAMTLDAFVNAMPFAELVKILPDPTPPGCHPVYQVRFALQNHPIPDVEVASLSAKLRMRSTGTARFELGCEITELDDGLEVAWLSRPDMFSPSDVAEMDREFRATLQNACDGLETAGGSITRPTELSSPIQ